MRCAESDTPIDPSRAAKLLNIDPGDESPETVAHEIDAAAPDISAEVLSQSQRGLFNSGS